MSPSALPQTGAYPLLGTGKLPNADIAYPGEVWSHKRANGVIIPGSAVIPVMVNDIECVKAVESDDSGFDESDVSVGLRQIMTPDINPGSQFNPALGPNEIVNLAIADMDYVREYRSGVVHLTLVAPDDSYAPGDVIGWDPDADRPAGKADGTGAWAKFVSGQDGVGVAGTDIFVVHTVPRYYGTTDEAVLTCRFRHRTSV